MEQGLTVNDWDVQAQLFVKATDEQISDIIDNAIAELVDRETRLRIQYDMKRCIMCKVVDYKRFMEYREYESTGKFVLLCRDCADVYDEHDKQV